MRKYTENTYPLDHSVNVSHWIFLQRAEVI